jgi:prepilin-type N-terminal cleavage/methylation domain-containing protein
MRRVRTRGFTLVELMVAVMVMTVGILGLASTAAVVMRMMHGGARQTLAANVVAARFEALHNKSCDSLSSGSSSTRGIAEDWTVSSAGSKLRLVVDRVHFTATSSGISSTRAFRSYIPCTTP